MLGSYICIAKCSQQEENRIGLLALSYMNYYFITQPTNRCAVVGRGLRWMASNHFFVQLCRDVQYVHWVMHKCITVKVRGKRNTHKVCKKLVNFLKTGEFVKVGGK